MTHPPTTAEALKALEKDKQIQKVIDILKEWREPTTGNRTLAIMIVEQLTALSSVPARAQEARDE